MGPIRTQKQPSTGPFQQKPRRKHYSQPEKESSTTPGVQKLKASLRQTRRLLAKDILAPDVRVETERRLKALEANLAQAETANRERSNAVRYHKIKFFERQKVIRKLTQTKKKLAAGESSSELQATLQNLRIDLNYILHYPKTKKYVSLFPPETRGSNAKDDDEPAEINEEQSSITDVGCSEVRSWVRGCMNSGQLPAEPELGLDSRGEPNHQPVVPKKSQTGTMEPQADWEERKQSRSLAKLDNKKTQTAKTEKIVKKTLDDFFENDDHSTDEDG